MASVNWLKQTKQKAGAMIRHLGKEERVRLNHTNTDIDKSKSELNYYIGCDDYVDAYRAMCHRVRLVDKISPPKRVVKGRVISFSLEAPCPKEIFEAGRSRDFFALLHQTYENFFGKENVYGTCVHLDEMHTYVEDGVEKTSLAHAHTLISAYAEWQEKDGTIRKGINGKHCETRQSLNELNKAVCDMVRENFGIEYNTGAKSKRGRTVEELKASAKLEQIKKETNDFVKSITPTKTKTVKGIFGSKIVEKSEDELEQDRQILAAQAILRREEELAKFEERLKSKEEYLNKLINQNSMVHLDRSARAAEKKDQSGGRIKSDIQRTKSNERIKSTEEFER